MITTDPGCYFHGEEPIPSGGYLCGECGHVYPTATDLLNAYNTELAQHHGVNGQPYTPVTNPDDIYFCPMCTHDW